MEIKTFSQLKKYCTKNNKTLYEAAQELETSISNTDVQTFRNYIKKTLTAMNEAIKNGLKSTAVTNGKMGGKDCHKQLKYYKNNPSIFGETYEKIICYALATSEENARMGKIAACPTAGACGIVPAVIIAYFEKYNTDIETQINSLIIAGLVGKIISNKIKPAGASGGCQAECGTASAMAAAAAAYITGCDIDEILNAAALSIKNILGLTCDPVKGFVEVPCIKRNPFMALHAITAVELAQAGIKSVIPIDEVIDAMEQTAALMSIDLKENSNAGLAKTKTALKMEI